MVVGGKDEVCKEGGQMKNGKRERREGEEEEEQK